MTEESPLILYVDDERSNRIVFEQSFNVRFRIKTVPSGAHALVVKRPEFPHELPAQSASRSSRSTDRPDLASE